VRGVAARTHLGIVVLCHLIRCRNVRMDQRRGYAAVVKLEKHKREDAVDLNRIESLVKNKIQNKFLPSCGRVLVANLARVIKGTNDEAA
jgi:hypothetical protein